MDDACGNHSCASCVHSTVYGGTDHQVSWWLPVLLISHLNVLKLPVDLFYIEDYESPLLP